MVGREVSLRSERAAFGIADIEEAAQEAHVGSPADTDKAPDADAEAGQPAETTKTDEPVLRIEGASVRGRGGARLLDEISLELRAGEIVGVAGVEGNGQRTLGDLLSSLVPLNAGRVVVNNAGSAHRLAWRHGQGRGGGDPRRPP